MSAADTRRDTGDFYPGGKRVVTTPVAMGGDVKHSDFADVTVETNTIPKMRQAIETLAQKLGATVAAVIAATFVANGAGFDSVPVNEIDFDENPSVVTNVTFDGLITEHQPLTNYYSKAETDAKIVELAPAPGNYSVVSNKAMTALQSYTETDPTISSWAKAASKPTYSLNDVAPNVENWLGVPGTTAGGKSIKVLAKTVNGVIEGGMTVTGSSNNDNNTTKYRYNGVTATRNGTATDYIFDTSSQSGIVRRSDIAGFADASDVATLANKVDAIETWAIGDETALVIREAGQTNATLTVTYTNNVMYSSAVAESNTLAKARAQTDSAIVTALEVVGEALDAKAPKAWGSLTSGGAPAPDDTLVVEKKKIAVTGGGNYASIESSTGCYYVLAVSLGTEWTLESLADAQNPTNAATVTFSDADGNGVYQIVSTASRTVDAIAGVDMLEPAVRVESGNDVVTMNFPVVAAEPPTMYYKPNLTNEFAEASSSNWPGVVSSVVWSGSSGLYTATVTMVGRPGSGFFCAKYIKPGSVYVRYMKPICVPSITLDDVTYTISVETINDKKLMVLTEVN